MAGRSGGGRSLAFGLALAVVGVTAFAPVAEPLDPAARPLNGPVIAVVTPETGAERAPPAAPTARAEAISRVQRCFAQLGYYKGPIDGKANDDTWTAHWYFKNDHGLKAYGDFLADAVQKKLRELCKEEVAAAPEPESAAEPEPATEPEPVTEPEAAQAAESEPAPAAAPEPLQATEPQTQAAEPEPLAEPMAEPDVQTNEEQVTVALAPAAEPQPAAEEEPVEPPPLARIDTDCLPEDLIGHLRAAHGDSVRARACTPGCLPSPAGLSQAQLDDLQARFGVAWCRDCVQIEGHLSLPDIWRIEGAGDFELCAMPPRHLPRPGIGNGNVAKSFTRIRELYREQTPAAEDQALIAVIIGNGTYDKLPPAETAANDAGAMYFFLTEHLGHRQDNIIDVRNARKADLERLFGPVPGSDGELARLVRAQPNAKVIVYYSGHGGTNSDHSETYLLPADAEPYREELSGYPLSTLYANLAALKAKSVLVLLESEYGRDHGAYVLPPNLPETTNSAVPQAPYTNVTVLSATDRGQRKLIDTSYDVGLFTRYLIEGLAGAADLYPVGNGDGMVDSAESFVYAAAMVRLAARKTFGLLQQPVYSSGATPVLSGAVAAKPN